MLNGAPAKGSSDVSSFSSCERAAVALVDGPFKDIDDEDVWEVCDTGDDKSCGGKTVPAFPAGELTSLAFDAKNSVHYNQYDRFRLF